MKKVGLKHYYGDLHTHTGFSDGKGTPKEAFEWAKQSKQGDFLAVSDHEGSITREKWLETLRAAQDCTDENFVGIASYESGYSEEYIDEDGVPIVNGGELNVFGTDQLLVEAGYPTDFQDFESKLASCEGAVAFYNHPQEASWPTDKIWNAYNDFGTFDAETDKRIVGMETSNETSAYNQIHELVYTTALDKGWHFAPFATSDTHHGKWLSDYQDRTVVLAPSLTRENIIEAFKARRVYAVQDRHIQIEFSINDQIIGSTLSPEEKTYHIKVEVIHKNPEEGKPFERVELISDGGKVVALNEEKRFHIKWNFTLESEEARYFFLRIVNEAGKKAWTAPIWTGRAPKAEKPYEKGTRIPFEQITIANQSSEQEQAKAIEILNKDTMTYWESKDTSGQIILDLGASKEIVGIGYRKNYIPYEDRKALAKLMDHYEYAVSEALEGEEQIVANGRVRNYGKEHYRGFEKVTARYIKIRALDSVEKGTVAIGNIYIYEA